MNMNMLHLQLLLVHPTYTQEEKDLIINSTWGELKRGDAPLYLRIRECVRRYIRSENQDYLETAKRLLLKNSKRIANDRFNLVSSYSSNPSARGNAPSGVKAGDKDEHGNMWVTYSREYVPYEDYIILQAVGELKGRWNNKTLAEGKTCGDVAAYRKLCKTNGVAKAMIIEYLGEEYVNLFLPKLIDTYYPKG